MAMPYNVAKNTNGYQIQTMHNGKWANIKDMNYETITEAYQKFITLINDDYVKRVPAAIREQNRLRANEMIRKFGESK